MKAVVYEDVQQLSIQQVPDPEVKRDTILVKPIYSYICATDIKTFKQGHPLIKPPTILGHEFSGIVSETGSDVSLVKPGDYVTGIPFINCGVCEMCIRGMAVACTDRQFPSNGTFAELLAMSETYARKGMAVISKAHLKEAGLSEPLACVLTSVRNFKPEPGDRILVVGAGVMGVMNALVLKHAFGVTTSICDTNAERLELPESLGIQPLTTDQALKGTYQAVILTAPVTDLIPQFALRITPFGHLVLFGGYPKGVMAEFDPNLIHYKGIKFIGSTGFSPQDFNIAVELIENGTLPLSTFTNDIYNFTDFQKAFDAAVSGSVLKAGLNMTGD